MPAPPRLPPARRFLPPDSPPARSPPPPPQPKPRSLRLPQLKPLHHHLFMEIVRFLIPIFFVSSICFGYFCIFMSLISLEGDRNGIYLFSLNRHFDRLLREPSTLIDHNPQKKTDTPTREVPLGMKLPFIRFLIMRKFMVPNESLHVRL